MAGRGRGRGRSVSFNVEALGFGRGEALPGSTFQPPPLFPLQEFKPVPLLQGEDYEYMLALKQEFRGAMRKSPYYIQPVEKKRDIQRYSDKYQLGPQDAMGNWTPDFRRLPAELKSKEKKTKKLKAAFIKPKLPRTLPSKDAADVVKTLEVLEQKEGETKEGEEKEEEDKEEGEEEEEEIYDEDELEEETDYISSYFDNGEGYGDDEEDVDEGPVY